MKQWIVLIGIILFFVGCAFASVEVEIMRWHAYEMMLHTKISFLQYMLIFSK